jgi:hypothetical protein
MVLCGFGSLPSRSGPLRVRERNGRRMRRGSTAGSVWLTFVADIPSSTSLDTDGTNERAARSVTRPQLARVSGRLTAAKF